MSSIAILASTTTDPLAPPTSPMNSGTHSESSEHKSSQSILPNADFYWCTSTKTWTTSRPDDFSDYLVIEIQNSKNAAVLGALRKYQQGLPNKRKSGDYIREGIINWLHTRETSVISLDQEEAFVKHVWFHMNEAIRRDRDADEEIKLQRELEKAKIALKSHYADFPEEAKTDAELCVLKNHLGTWSKVVTGEQRRIASKKRHDKEERLIATKFCGDRPAYNRWKTLNEKVSLGRIRDVSPQLLIKFAKWLEANPDFLYPGSCDISYSQAEYKIDPTTDAFFSSGIRDTPVQHFDVSDANMLSAIKSLMTGLKHARIITTLTFDRSPKQFTMTDKYPIMDMHGCERLISGCQCSIIAIHDNKLVFERSSTIIKRLPDEYHTQLKGHCERERMFKELYVHNVYLYEPGLVSKVECNGHTEMGERFNIHLRGTSRASKTFSFDTLENKKRLDFLEGLKKEAMVKKTAAQQSRVDAARVHPPSPRGSRHSNMAQEIIELGKMLKDGLLTNDEFCKAKADLLR
jgi:hypothetical protein